MPTAPTYVEGAAARDRFTAQVLEQHKINKHGAAAISHGHKFIPFAMEAFGRLGEKASGLIQMLGERHGPMLAWDLRKEVAMANQQANVEMLVSFLSTRPRGSETDHIALGRRPLEWQYRVALNHKRELQNALAIR